jgi:hypothetical protein
MYPSCWIMRVTIVLMLVVASIVFFIVRRKIQDRKQGAVQLRL